MIRQVPLKTLRKYVVRMGWPGGLGLPIDVLKSVGSSLASPCQCTPDCLAASIDGVWDWTVRFICKICGKSYYCQCFKPALEKHYMEALEKRGNYAKSGWPRKFIEAYDKSEFRDRICHLCRDIPCELYYCNPMYGSSVRVHYGPYIKRIAIEKNVTDAEAENEVRDMLGIPHIGEGWISETELLNMVKGIFPQNEVIHQSSPQWLGRQRLDIFLPELKIAVEYQGLQHYKPVPFFGGDDGFRQTRERDLLKARLCSQNGVALIYFRYDEMISRELVETRMRGTCWQSTNGLKT